MTRKRFIHCGAALLVATFGLEVGVAKDPPSKSPGGGEAVSHGLTPKTTESSKQEPVIDVDGRRATKNDKLKEIDPELAAKLAVDEDAIRQTGAAYVKAFCDGDAKSIATLFTPDAEYVDEQGNLFQGREAIEAAMTTLFRLNPDCEIELEINSIRFISPGVAIEDGMTAFSASDDAEPMTSHYSAVHVKANGQWLAASVREQAPRDRRQNRTQLQQLEWLQGEWVDESEESLVVFSCEAAKGGNYLVRTFVIQIAGQEALSGKQRIGWDPIAERLRTWTFDSEGGFNDGLWYRDENGWILKSSGFTAQGQTASGTSIYRVINSNTMTWQSVDHEIDGIGQPDSEVITIVRRSPKPDFLDETPLSKSN